MKLFLSCILSSLFLTAVAMPSNADEPFAVTKVICCNETFVLGRVPVGKTLQILHVASTNLSHRYDNPRITPTLTILAEDTVVGVCAPQLSGRVPKAQLFQFNTQFRDEGAGSGIIVPAGQRIVVRLESDPLRSLPFSAKVSLAGVLLDDPTSRIVSYSAIVQGSLTTLATIPVGKRLLIKSIHSGAIVGLEPIPGVILEFPALELSEESKTVMVLSAHSRTDLGSVGLSATRPVFLDQVIGPVIRGGSRLNARQSVIQPGQTPQPTTVIVAGVLE